METQKWMRRYGDRTTVYLGNSCNNACVFCGQVVERRIQQIVWTPDIETMKKALMAERDRGSISCSFQGGEPTVMKALPHYIYLAKKLEFKEISITTNGRRLSSQNYLNLLMKNGLNNAVISIHGPNGEIHDDLVRVKGAFSQVAKALLNLNHVRIKNPSLTIGINTVLLKRNIALIGEMAVMVRKSEARHWLLLPFHPFPGITRDKFEIDKESMIEGFEIAKKICGSRVSVTLFLKGKTESEPRNDADHSIKG